MIAMKLDELFRHLVESQGSDLIIRTRARLNEIYAHHTGQDLKTIEPAMERDKFMSAEEAREFGLIDEVVKKRKISSDAAEESNDSKGE